MSDGTTSIDSNDDIIDSRDVIARIDFLTSCKEDESTEGGLALDEDEEQELRDLIVFAREGETSDDWQYGATLIRDSYFEDYAQEYADDIGAIDRDAAWPTSHIDWEAAARDLQQDYTSVEFDGITYWVR